MSRPLTPSHETFDSQSNENNDPKNLNDSLHVFVTLLKQICDSYIVNIYSPELIQIYKDSNDTNEFGEKRIPPNERKVINKRIEEFRRSFKENEDEVELN